MRALLYELTLSAVITYINNNNVNWGPWVIIAFFVILVLPPVCYFHREVLIDCKKELLVKSVTHTQLVLYILISSRVHIYHTSNVVIHLSAL